MRISLEKIKDIRSAKQVLVPEPVKSVGVMPSFIGPTGPKGDTGPTGPAGAPCECSQGSDKLSQGSALEQSVLELLR